MQGRLHRIIVISILILSLSASYVYAINGGGGPSRTLLADPTPAAPGPAAAGVGGPPSDTTPPSVNIASPGAGWSLTSTIGIIAGAADNVGIDRVDFYIDGAKVGSDSSAPYTFDWNTTTVPDGTHTISVAAYDTAGNVGSAAQFVTVANGAVTAAAVLGVAAQPTALPTALRRLYRVHIGAFIRLRQAQRVIARLRRRGFAGEMITQGGARPYLIQAGLLEDLASARSLVQRLRRRGFRYNGIQEILGP